MDDFLKSLDSAKEEMNKVRASYNEAAKKTFYDGVKQLFTLYPWLQAFSWRQGTSSFCDGDPCYFHVRAEDGNLTIDIDTDLADKISEGVSEDVTEYSLRHRVSHGMKSGRRKEYDYNTRQYEDIDYMYEDYDYEPNEGAEEVIALFEILARFINAFSEDTLEELFGDPVKVTVRSDGTIDTESDYFE